MQWKQIFKFGKNCTHDKVPIDADYYYCPDCGELIENKWYLLRCSSCGLKIPATIINGEIVPKDSFCHNCGAKSCNIERLEKIDCININYAVLLKEVVNIEYKEYTQSWIDFNQTSDSQQKLLQQYL